MKKEIIQVRCSLAEKEKIKNASLEAGISMSNYILQSLEKDQFTLSLFGRFEDKIERVSNNIESSLYLIKEDTEMTLDRQISTGKGVKLVNIIDSIKDKLDAKNYKIGDLLTYKNRTVYMVQFSDLRDEIYIQNIKTGTIGEYNFADKDFITLLSGLITVQRRI